MLTHRHAALYIRIQRQIILSSIDLPSILMVVSMFFFEMFMFVLMRGLVFMLVFMFAVDIMMVFMLMSMGMIMAVLMLFYMDMLGIML